MDKSIKEDKINKAFKKARQIKLREEEIGKYNHEVLKMKAELAACNTKDWCGWSLNPSNFDEILLRNIIENFYKVSLICNSYVCSSLYPFTSDMVNDYIFVTTDLFKINTWNSQMVDAVVNYIINNEGKAIIDQKGNIRDNKLYKLMIKYKYSSEIFKYKLTDRLDWKLINSLEVINNPKYKPILDKYRRGYIEIPTK